MLMLSSGGFMAYEAVLFSVKAYEARAMFNTGSRSRHVGNKSPVHSGTRVSECLSRVYTCIYMSATMIY